MTGDAIGEQVELLLLDAVLHVASGAVEASIQVPGRTLEVGQNIARVGSPGTVLGLDDDAPGPVPALCGIGELAEAALLAGAARKGVSGRIPPGRRASWSLRSS